MALIELPVTRGQPIPLSGVGVRRIGRCSDKAVCTWVLTIRNSAALSLSILGIPSDSALDESGATQLAYQIGSTGASASTAITADGIYFIRADGLDVLLNLTAGTATIYLQPREG